MNIKHEPPTPLTPEQSPTRLEGTPRVGPVATVPRAEKFPRLPLTETSKPAAIEKGSESSGKADKSPPPGSRSLLVAPSQREKLRRLIAQNSGEYSAASRELKRELYALSQAREAALNELDGSNNHRQNYGLAEDSTECYCDFGEHFLDDY